MVISSKRNVHYERGTKGRKKEGASPGLTGTEDSGYGSNNARPSDREPKMDFDINDAAGLRELQEALRAAHETATLLESSNVRLSEELLASNRQRLMLKREKGELLRKIDDLMVDIESEKKVGNEISVEGPNLFLPTTNVSHADEHDVQWQPETRASLLKDMKILVEDTRSESISLLDGMAGTGKSIISRTIAKSLADEGQSMLEYSSPRVPTDFTASDNLYTSDDDRLGNSPLLKPMKVNLKPSPSPPPAVALYVFKATCADIIKDPANSSHNRPQVSPESSPGPEPSEKRKSNRPKNKPSQGDAVLVSFMDNGRRPEIELEAAKQPLQDNGSLNVFIANQGVAMEENGDSESENSHVSGSSVASVADSLFSSIRSGSSFSSVAGVSYTPLKEPMLFINELCD